MTWEEINTFILQRNPGAKAVLDRQQLLEVQYLDKSGDMQGGQILIDKDLASEIRQLFDFLITQNYRLEKVVPIQAAPYFGDDDLSMADNNTSAMNYRFIAGTNRLSMHSFGFAIDINPRDNPIQKDGVTLAPPGAVRDTAKLEVFTETHPVVQWLEGRGWEWGGRWLDPYQDYHHFQKPLRIIPSNS